MANFYGTNNNDTLDGTSSADIFYGANGDDLLRGYDGNDQFYGGAGNDTMIGGLGNDLYIVEDAGDIVSENVDEGIDTVYSKIDYTLGPNVEILMFANNGLNLNGTGNNLNNNITGNNGNNILNGGDGDDTISGGDGNDTLDGGAGNDHLSGDAGDDTYIVDSINDLITEGAGQGTDTVQANFTYTLGNNLENLTLTGSGNISGYGNSLNNVITGNSSNNTLDGKAGADTMIGGLGNDTYIIDDAGDVVVENVGEGIDIAYAKIDYTLTANVETLILANNGLNINGTGNTLNNSITGNNGNNILSGGDGNDTIMGMDGNDTLDGGAGNDYMVGGAGDDIYMIDSIYDQVIELAGQGTDTVMVNYSYWLLNHFENVTLTGTGNIYAIGNSLDNVMIGNNGNNYLNGGAGNDTMIGGLGNDRYYVTEAGDVVIENAGEGEDSVYSEITYTLGTNVEHLLLKGSNAIDGTGNALNNQISGNAADNILDGGDGDDIIGGSGGNDTLIGGLGNDYLYGGTGADTMIGGLGDDLYNVDDVGDVIIENAGEGTDKVYSSISYSLLGTQIENLSVIGYADLTVTGNGFNNILVGNNGNNIIDGGLGADEMYGGIGNDTFIVDNVGDTVTEEAGEGTDWVQSTVSFTLGTNIENLTLLGSGNIDGSGNALSNNITGNDGNNILDGNGGNDTLRGLGGNDTLIGSADGDILIGGTGDDTYYLYSALNTITELAGEGTDTVRAGFTYTLGSNLENLVLTGTGNINGIGNSLNNTITGNNGNNTLNGGAGADIMTGGGGDDLYMVDNAGDVVNESASSGYDTVYSTISYTLTSNVEALILANNGQDLNGTGNNLNNNITGNNGNNILDGGTGQDILDGGAGNDTIYGGGGQDILMGGDGDDFLDGEGGNDILDGGLGTNELRGRNGTDEYRYGGGNDTMFDQNNSSNDIYNFTKFFDDYMVGQQTSNPLPVTTGTIYINDRGGSNDILVIHEYNTNTAYLDMMTFEAVDRGAGIDNLLITFDVPGNTSPFTIEIQDYFRNGTTNSGRGLIENIVLSGTSYIPEGYESYDQGAEIVLDFADVVALLV